MDAFAAGASLSERQVTLVRPVLWAWARFAGELELSGWLRGGQGRTSLHKRNLLLRERYEELVERGVDPLNGKCKEVLWKL
jgi:hypothetical protein